MKKGEAKATRTAGSNAEYPRKAAATSVALLIECYYNGSRFIMLNTVTYDDEFKEELKNSSESEALADAFIENGGVPNFSQQMTVIGQIYSGMDVAEKLAQLETNEMGVYKFPKEDILINSVTISTFSSEDEITDGEKKD